MKCLNFFCRRDVPFDKKAKRTKSFCSSCSSANSKKDAPRFGVFPFKKFVCDNFVLKHLGFECPVNWGCASLKDNPYPTHVDHIDGNWRNNVRSNAQELCDYCHKIKGKINGDLNRWKNYSETDPSV